MELLDTNPLLPKVNCKNQDFLKASFTFWLVKQAETSNMI